MFCCIVFACSPAQPCRIVCYKTIPGIRFMAGINREIVYLLASVLATTRLYPRTVDTILTCFIIMAPMWHCVVSLSSSTLQKILRRAVLGASRGRRYISTHPPGACLDFRRYDVLISGAVKKLLLSFSGISENISYVVQKQNKTKRNARFMLGSF